MSHIVSINPLLISAKVEIIVQIISAPKIRSFTVDIGGNRLPMAIFRRTVLELFVDAFGHP